MLEQCRRPEHHALLRITAAEGSGLVLGVLSWDQVLGILIFLAAVVFAVSSIKDIHRFTSLFARPAVARAKSADPSELNAEVNSQDHAKPRSGGGSEAIVDRAVRPPWPTLALVALTSYRFYTGFLSATWLPYLLAMEGQYLWQEKQSLFMGLAKLIYGATILMNPLFGLIGDQAVALSHGVGRRLFVRAGLTLAALGMYICILSGRDHAFLSFLSGILVWRLGEALNDVTTEALVPEMVPHHQYQLASAIKASSFLLGGLFGYVLLIVFVDAHYSWLYYAYPIGMFVASLPPLYLLDQDALMPQGVQQQEQDSFVASLVRAYVDPMRYPGGFPRACLAVFVFSLGTAPMFFLLLIVRDLVGVQDRVVMQQQFSLSSIVFFVSAAVASVLSGLADPGRSSSAAARADAASLERKGRLLVESMVSFGVVVFAIPALCLVKEERMRNAAFFSLTVVFGAAFGAAFTLFQDLTWQLLPPGVNVANAMGFNVMSRLLGVGLGNFASGMILDFTYRGGHAEEVYEPVGYAIMCSCSGLAVVVSAFIAHSVIGAATQEELKPLGGQSAVPIA